MAENIMDEKAKEARRAYYREYRAKHPEKVREQNRRYWARRAAREAAEREVGNAPHENN